MTTATATRPAHSPTTLGAEALVIESRVAAAAALCIGFLESRRAEWDTTSPSQVEPAH